MDGNFRNLPIEIARLIRKGDSEGGGARLLRHQVILHSRVGAAATQDAVLVGALHFLDLKNTIILDLKLQDAGQGIGQSLFLRIFGIQALRAVGPDLPEHGGIVGVLVAQIQVEEKGCHHEVVRIIGGLADGAAVQNRLLGDHLKGGVIGRLLLRLVNFLPLGIGQLQIHRLGVLHGVIILGIVLRRDLPGKGIHQVGPCLNTVFVTLFQHLHPGHGILQFLLRFRRKLAFFLIGVAVIDPFVLLHHVVVLRVHQAGGVRQGIHKVRQLRRRSFHHDDRNRCMKLDILLLVLYFAVIAVHDKVDDRFVTLDRDRMLEIKRASLSKQLRRNIYLAVDIHRHIEVAIRENKIANF